MKLINSLSIPPFTQDRVSESAFVEIAFPSGSDLSSSITSHQQNKKLFQMSDKELNNLVNKANNKVRELNTELDVSFYKGTNQMMIKIINSDTQEIIKEIPPEKIVDLVYKICEQTGVFTDLKI